MTDTLLVVFTKAPGTGRVKTRLCPPLTPERASAVHEASLRDVVAGARSVHPRVHIRHDEAPGSHEWFAEAFPDLPRSGQGTGDLGDRLRSTFDDFFGDGAGAVVVLGSDSPTLPAARLRQGIDALGDHELVLGPTRDGGYYLIGLHRRAWPRARALLRDIPWSTSRVLEETLDRLTGVDLSLRLLGEWYDVDRIDDLRRAGAEAPRDSHLGRLLDGDRPETVMTRYHGRTE